MKKSDLKKFRELLLEEKRKLIDKALTTIGNGAIHANKDDIQDEMDFASTEVDQSLLLRLRDRERKLINKIDKALEKIDDGSFGTCETCGEEIRIKRLEARPVQAP